MILHKVPSMFSPIYLTNGGNYSARYIMINDGLSLKIPGKDPGSGGEHQMSRAQKLKKSLRQSFSRLGKTSLIF